MKTKKKKENYLKIPNHILNIPRKKLDFPEKILLAHIYSFGRRGCWQGNETLGKMFFVDARTISRWIAKLKKAGVTLWLHPKGRYRTIWAKSHPDVITATNLLYFDEEISKRAVISGHAKKILLRQPCRKGIDTSVVATTTSDCIQVRQPCLHTNNTTIKDTTTNTTATPSPLPAGGQSSALLEDRRQGNIESYESFKRSFGGTKKNYQPLSKKEIETRKQRQLTALGATGT